MTCNNILWVSDNDRIYFVHIVAVLFTRSSSILSHSTYEEFFVADLQLKWMLRGFSAIGKPEKSLRGNTAKTLDKMRVKLQ
jgi:imidazoleglycerol phosphate synthase glutamine amidotransferase subunit HisH